MCAAPLSSSFPAYPRFVVIHIGQFVRYKLLYLLCTAIAAGLLEITGWAARLYSHYYPEDLAPYLVQSVFPCTLGIKSSSYILRRTVTTINGPTPLVAAYFVILAEIIRRLGPCYSRLRPKLCKFLSASFRGRDPKFMPRPQMQLCSSPPI